MVQLNYTSPLQGTIGSGYIVGILHYTAALNKAMGSGYSSVNCCSVGAVGGGYSSPHDCTVGVSGQWVSYTTLLAQGAVGRGYSLEHCRIAIGSD